MSCYRCAHGYSSQSLIPGQGGGPRSILQHLQECVEKIYNFFLKYASGNLAWTVIICK